MQHSHPILLLFYFLLVFLFYPSTLLSILPVFQPHPATYYICLPVLDVFLPVLPSFTIFLPVLPIYPLDPLDPYLCFTPGPVLLVNLFYLSTCFTRLPVSPIYLFHPSTCYAPLPILPPYLFYLSTCVTRRSGICS